MSVAVENPDQVFKDGRSKVSLDGDGNITSDMNEDELRDGKKGPRPPPLEVVPKIFSVKLNGMVRKEIGY